MRRMAAVWMAVGLAVTIATGAAASEALDMTALKAQAKKNKALSRYLKMNGYPEVAEVKPVIDQAPWDNYEVTLYYLARHKEISFARARVLGQPEVHIMRYERTMTDADVRGISQRPPLDTTASADGDQHASAAH